MGHYMHFEIARTGKLAAMYTLYIENVVSGDNFCFQNRFFVQNLSMEEGPAWDKANTIKEKYEAGNSDLKTTIDLFDSPKREYCDMKAFGIEWKKTEHGFRAYPDNGFWDIWRKHKSLLKDAGFSVFKSDTGEFIAFFFNTSQEEMVKALQSMNGKIEVAEETGSYAGKTGDRLKGIKVIVNKLFESQTMYGLSQILHFSDEEGRAYKSKYSGKHEFEEGREYSIAATIKELTILDGTRTTVVNRIGLMAS